MTTGDWFGLVFLIAGVVGLPLLGWWLTTHNDGHECVCGEINMRHCPVHQGGTSEGEGISGGSADG